MLESLRFVLFSCSGLFILMLCFFGVLLAGQGIWKQVGSDSSDEDSQLSLLESLTLEISHLSERIAYLEAHRGSGTWTTTFALWSLRRRLRDLEQRRARILGGVNRASSGSMSIRLPGPLDPNPDTRITRAGILRDGIAPKKEPEP